MVAQVLAKSVLAGHRPGRRIGPCIRRRHAHLPHAERARGGPGAEIFESGDRPPAIIYLQ
ncbi:hypothetical protein BV133_3123 [Blastochloris viridis]|uniref:Uncharacterized protein n=1 Tax=Blastochloris viridis TaxID=1079 RepID=A0A182D5C4_BLAVI|nr:hypothetical protein BV133_3123 [Blastochloris viridis]